MLIWLASFLAASLIVLPAGASAAETISVPTTGTIIESISVTCEFDGLSFGEISPGPTPGTVTVTFTSHRTTTGGVGLGDVGASAAQCSVRGAGGHRYTIVLSETPILLTNTTGGGTMRIIGVRVQHPNRTLDESGRDTFNLSGTLIVGADQPPGVYSGVFVVRVAYV